MAVEHELFREVLGADSQRLRGSRVAGQGRREQDGGGRFAERSHCSLVVGADVRARIRKNDPNRVQRRLFPVCTEEWLGAHP